MYIRAPFHCTLMKEAADVMEEAFKSIEFKKPCVDVVSNVTAKPVKRRLISKSASFISHAFRHSTPASKRFQSFWSNR